MKKLLILLTLGLMFGQTKLETRVYEIDTIVGYNGGIEETFDLLILTGYDLDIALVSLYDYYGNCCEGNTGFQLRMDVFGVREKSASLGDYRNGQISASGIGTTIIFNADEIAFTSVNTLVTIRSAIVDYRKIVHDSFPSMVNCDVCYDSHNTILMIFQRNRQYRFDFFYIFICILLVVTAILS